jgi:hypothetical protein
VVPGPFGDEPLDFPNFWNPAGNPQNVIDEQSRSDIDTMVDHLPPIAKKMNLGLHPHFVQSLADIGQGLFTAAVAFGFAKDVDTHLPFPLPKK